MRKNYASAGILPAWVYLLVDYMKCQKIMYVTDAHIDKGRDVE